VAVVDDLTRLALAAGAGDREALGALVRRTQADVWRLCAHLGGRDEADDVTQEVFLRVFRGLAAFRGEAPVRAWILAIARRTVADAIRGNQRRRRLLEQRRTLGTVDEPDPAGLVAVEELVGGLTPDRREAFVLTQVVGLSYAEAAEVCDVPVGTIRSRVARARADLVDAIGSGIRPAADQAAGPPADVSAGAAAAAAVGAAAGAFAGELPGAFAGELPGEPAHVGDAH
jgi:RNA polymerase sigma-70 factor, ECF subfamily